jgi:mannan polymerase II complex ANP1 subunit
VDDLRQMEEMDLERQAREREEGERAQQNESGQSKTQDADTVNVYSESDKNSEEVQRARYAKKGASNGF